MSLYVQQVSFHSTVTFFRCSAPFPSHCTFPCEIKRGNLTVGHLLMPLFCQQLSTYRLSHEERSDPDCDVLTGVHVVDSKFRMIMLEGLQRGAMGLVMIPKN